MKYLNQIRFYKIFIFLIGIFSLAIMPRTIFARELSEITDWYIKDFQSKISVNTDASLTVEERIVADCGNLPEKHGIFRVVPTQIKTDKGTIKTPVTLVSITDFDGTPLNFYQKTNNFDHVVSWQIGDPETTVTGESNYKITYTVENAIRSTNAEYDELYWNLTGNFWDIQIDKFNADIVFPAGIGKNNSETEIYGGKLGEKQNLLAESGWPAENVFRVASTKTIKEKEGITASITFPKNIVTPYVPSFWELYGDYFWFLMPLAVFIFCFTLWNKHGKDPKIDKTIIPEFEIPEDQSPLEMGMLLSNGGFNDKLITASIVDLAVKKYLVIEEIAKPGILAKQDFYLQKTDKDTAGLGVAEIIIIEKIFSNERRVKLSSLNQKFYKYLPQIKKEVIKNLEQKELIFASGLVAKSWLIGFFILFSFIFFVAVGTGIIPLIISAIISGATILGFALVMPKRTQKGAELNWRIKGFRLYMETAEKYRAQFYEKEYIFEKFLPYAIMFGMTKLWIKKMEEIYGKEYYRNYHPAWYAGSSIGSFDADSFSAHMAGISSGIASNVGTSSGAHGGGGAGGGGGGGGGGGW